MAGRVRKKNVKLIIAVSVLAVTALFIAALSVTNIFLPVKYLSAYIVKSESREGGGMRVRFIDVGYGDCALFEFPDGTSLLIDGGDGRYSNNKKILKTLNESGIDKLDYLICTSVRQEHSGGLAEIIRYKKVKKAFVPYCAARDITPGFSSLRAAIDGSGVEAGYCEYGNGVFGDNFGFCFLSPDSRGNESPYSDYYLLNNDPSERNIKNASAIVYIYCGDAGVLMLGDNTRKKVEALYGQYSADGCFLCGGREIKTENCKIIKIGGHGSADSAYSGFYNLIKPEYAVVSTSEDLLPSAQSISDAERYSKLYKTYENGTVTAIIDGGVEMYKEKE